MWNITSGSVIGPVLTREVSRRGKQAVNFVVADEMSERDIQNTIRTLQTLQSITEMGKIYLPTVVFSNGKVGRQIIDVTLPHRLGLLINLLTLPAIEIDRNDRRNFLNPMKTADALPGVRLMHVIGGDADRDDDQNSGEIWAYDNDAILDSTLSLGVLHEGQQYPSFVDRRFRARAAYEGTFREHILTPVLGAIASGNAAIGTLLTDLHNELSVFSTQSRQQESSIRMDDAIKDESGMVW